MAGVKGKSGRKSNANELFKLSTIEECWKLVSAAIQNKDIHGKPLDPPLDLEYRTELASRHTVKSIPTELAGGITASLVAMGTITKSDGGLLTFNIGSAIAEIADESDPPQDS